MNSAKDGNRASHALKQVGKWAGGGGGWRCPFSPTHGQPPGHHAQDLVLALCRAFQPDLKIHKDASALLTTYVNAVMEGMGWQAGGWWFDNSSRIASPHITSHPAYLDLVSRTLSFPFPHQKNLAVQRH